MKGAVVVEYIRAEALKEAGKVVKWRKNCVVQA
jgi:hypothetical protein